jgi:hypothetical protein
MKILMRKKETLLLLALAGIALPAQVSAQTTLQNIGASQTVIERTLAPRAASPQPEILIQEPVVPPSRITYQMEPIYENPENRVRTYDQPLPHTLEGSMQRATRDVAPATPQVAPNQNVVTTYKYNPDTGVRIDNNGQVVLHPQDIAPASGPVVEQTPAPAKSDNVPPEDDSLMPTLR